MPDIVKILYMIIKGKNKAKIPAEKKAPAAGISPGKKKLPEKFTPKIKERQERRRGDRRRGYRRIDDRNIISRAQEEANTIRELASKEGFEHSASIYKEEIEKLNHAINEFLAAKEKVMRCSIPDIAVLAVKAAEKIIKKEVELDDKLILNMVSEVIKSVSRDETEIIVRTNPKDTKIVKENLPEIYPQNEKTTVTVIPEENVERGSCVVETRNGIVDANFSTQLQILQKALDAGTGL